MTTNQSPEGLAERLEKALPLLEELATGRDCEDYAFARGKGFQAMTSCPDAFEALRALPAAIAALRDHTGAGDALLREAHELLAWYAGCGGPGSEAPAELLPRIDAYLSRTPDREPFDRRDDRPIGEYLPTGTDRSPEAAAKRILAFLDWKGEGFGSVGPSMNYGDLRILATACSEPFDRKADEDMGLCIGCNQPIRVGEVVTPYDDEICHADCRAPASLTFPPLPDDCPPAQVLVGFPSRYVPVEAIHALSTKDGEQGEAK